MKRHVSAVVICAILATPLHAQPAPRAAKKIAELKDLSNDWTLLSPRRHCLANAGLKGSVGEGSMEREVGIWEEETEFRTYQRTLDRWKAGYEASDRNAERFKDLITKYSQGLGPLALPEKLDIRAIRKWTTELQEIPSPVLRPSVPGVYNQDPIYLAEGESLRACMLEFFASAYGIGEADVEGRYAAAANLWKQSGSQLYSGSMISLNYLTARNRLAQGDEPGAFALTNDPAMIWASRSVPHVAPWRASFHQYGVGTKVSLLDAARIYDEGYQLSNSGIQSALLKASAGQNDIAAAQLRTWMTSAWRSDEQMADAQRAYQAITGAKFQQAKASADPLSNLIGGLFVVSLGILAHCLSKATNCPTAGPSGSNTGESSTEQINRQFRDQQDRLEAIQNFSWAANGFKN
ncbi:hypothetical protein [Sphingopyxis panaciterrae]